MKTVVYELLCATHVDCVYPSQQWLLCGVNIIMLDWAETERAILQLTNECQVFNLSTKCATTREVTNWNLDDANKPLEGNAFLALRIWGD